MSRRPRFAVIGDLTLDVTVAPSRPPRSGGDVPATIRLGPGGQAANVAVRLARRGVAVTLVAALADDAAGRLLRDALAADGVTLLALSAHRSASVVALLDAAGERTMLSDRQRLDPAGIAERIADADWVHCSGYALLDDDAGDELATALGARHAGVRLSVGGGSVPPEAPRVARLRRRLAVARPDLLIVNHDEASAMLGAASPSAVAAATALAPLATVVIVTAGARGSAAHVAGETLEIRSGEPPGRMLDATGSGDGYAAALLETLSVGPWPPDGDRLRAAMEAGSRLGSLVSRVLGAQGRVDGEPDPRR